MKPKEIDFFDLLIALYREDNKWFDEQINAINASNKNITIENILKVGGRELFSSLKTGYLVKEGYIHITNENELPALTPKAKEALAHAVKVLLSRRSEYHRKLYEKDIADYQKKILANF